ncbi:flagellar hook-associated protein FlgL [uncultured Clostridium sp.]|jgi:flagellar hook-associated protein 3 FlgL|uniref:flagellar hook-associated protein FlgL n=1 Tax=uncultured Clostridium sp. TaxID=59620 RepID=UPI00260DBB5A|nr:flagellar hook-associated protein FlgL [uncultured Clostridium sp.]
MRVTNRMMSSSFLNDMNRNLNNMQKVQGQLTTGKLVNKPSDNPFVVARSMQLYSDISANEQYNTNIKDTTNWLDATDTALGQVTDTLQRVRELMVTAGNAAYGTDEKNAIKDEINQRIEEVGTILNTSFDGKYIFGGTKGTSRPVTTEKDADGNINISYAGKDGSKIPLNTSNHLEQAQLDMIGKDLSVEISQGVTIEYNVNAKDVLEFEDSKGNSQNVMDLLSNITRNIGSENEEESSKVTGENLENMTRTIDNLLTLRAEVGAKQNRMESAQSKNEEENFNLTEVLSGNEDINFTEKRMESATMQTVYMASLQTASKVIQQTLLDYI